MSEFPKELRIRPQTKRVATKQESETPAQKPACWRTRQAGVSPLAMRQYATPVNSRFDLCTVFESPDRLRGVRP